MTIYKVTNENVITEFTTQVDAEEYISEHGGTLSQYEKETKHDPNIKDVTPRQMRQALVLSGVSMTQIEDALATLPEPTKTLAIIEWEYSTMFLRANPLVTTVGTMLGWTEQQLDDLWRLAATL